MGHMEIIILKKVKMLDLWESRIPGGGIAPGLFWYACLFTKRRKRLEKGALLTRRGESRDYV